MKKLFTNRVFRQGGAAVLITVIAIALAVLLNMLVGALSGRLGLSLDLTTGGLFTLSDETQEFMRTVDKPVQLTLFLPREDFVAASDYHRQAAEMMDDMAAANPNLRLQYVDIITNPGYTSQYPTLNLSNTSILAECEGRTHVLDIADLFNTEVDYNTYSSYISSSKAEQAIATAILNVTDTDKLRVSVLSGHDEAPVDDFVRTLEMNGYEVVQQNLMTETPDPEATILVIAAPARDLTEAEATKLDTFLSNDGKLGKNLFYLAEATQPEEMPVLDAFLAEWGVAVQPGIVYETNQNNLFGPSAFFTLAAYAEEEYSADVQAKSLPFAMPNARPVQALFESQGYTQVSTLLQFPESSGVVPAETTGEFEPEPSGPHGGLILAQRLNYDGTTPMMSHVLVAGSSLVLNAQLIGSQNYANSEYLINLLNKMAGREQSFSVQNKTITYTELGINLGQASVIGIIFTIVIPLLVLVGGIVVWLRRRHR